MEFFGPGRKTEKRRWRTCLRARRSLACHDGQTPGGTPVRGLAEAGLLHDLCEAAQAQRGCRRQRGITTGNASNKCVAGQTGRDVGAWRQLRRSGQAGSRETAQGTRSGRSKRHGEGPAKEGPGADAQNVASYSMLDLRFPACKCDSDCAALRTAAARIRRASGIELHARGLDHETWLC